MGAPVAVHAGVSSQIYIYWVGMLRLSMLGPGQPTGNEEESPVAVHSALRIVLVSKACGCRASGGKAAHEEQGHACHTPPIHVQGEEISSIRCRGFMGFFFFGFVCVFFFPFFVKFFLVSPCNLDYSVWWAGQRTGSEEESPVAVHPGRAGTEMNAWATVERQMEDGATVHEVG